MTGSPLSYRSRWAFGFLRRRAAAIVVYVVLASTGCSTHADRVQSMRASYFNGNLNLAQSTSAELLEKPKRDADAIKLNQAIIQLTSGDAAGAERTMREVRDRLDHLQQRSLAEDTVSLATDDTRKAYAGEDYERILLHVFLSLSSTFSGSGDADAYALQTVSEQEETLNRYRERDKDAPGFKRIAVGPYLRAALLEDKPMYRDDVARSRVQVAKWEPDFPDAQSDIQRAQYGRHSEKGNGVLYVFSLVGRGPVKQQVSEQPTSRSLLIADRILSAISKYQLPPTIAPVKVARVVEDPCGPDAIQVAVNGRPIGQTNTITDIGQLAVQQYAAVYPHVIARAVARRVLKKGAIYAAKEQAGVDQNSLLDLAFTAGGVAWEATEKADTRCWSLLPDRIQVLRIELPVGTHQIALTPIKDRASGQHATATVEIRDGHNSWMMASFPDDRLVGEVLVR